MKIMKKVMGMTAALMMGAMVMGSSCAMAAAPASAGEVKQEAPAEAGTKSGIDLTRMNIPGLDVEAAKAQITAQITEQIKAATGSEDISAYADQIEQAVNAALQEAVSKALQAAQEQVDDLQEKFPMLTDAALSAAK